MKAALRLIHPASIAPRQVEAAMAGLDPFRGFGIMVESVPACHIAFEGVRHPDSLRQVAFAESDVRIDSIRTSPGDLGRVFGIAVTPHRILCSSDSDIMVIAGMGGYLESGVLSFNTPLKQLETLRNLMITMLLTYEAGHLLIPKKEAPDCPDEHCLMRRNSGFPQTLQRMTAKMDFCAECSGAIMETVRQLTNPFIYI